MLPWSTKTASGGQTDTHAIHQMQSCSLIASALSVKSNRSSFSVVPAPGHGVVSYTAFMRDMSLAVLYH